MLTTHTTITLHSTLSLDYHGDGWWHIEEWNFTAGRMIDWYMEGYDTAKNTFDLLTAHPSEVG